MLEWLNSIGNLNVVPTSEVILRCVLAMVFAMVIGWDRDSKNKPIDFRAYMIVAVTTCVIAIMGQELYADYETTDNILRIDLTKLIEGVLTGIGFLGAGAIIKRDNDRIVGTATGASIWASGGIGLALGFGFYELAFLAFGAVAIILIGGGFLLPAFQGEEDKIEKKDKEGAES
ncbi:MAG: MgtC/SapB family protein [Alphaproteobacteria bacterium]